MAFYSEMWCMSQSTPFSYSFLSLILNGIKSVQTIFVYYFDALLNIRQPNNAVWGERNSFYDCVFFIALAQQARVRGGKESMQNMCHELSIITTMLNMYKEWNNDRYECVDGKLEMSDNDESNEAERAKWARKRERHAERKECSRANMNRKYTENCCKIHSNI